MSEHNFESDLEQAGLSSDVPLLKSEPNSSSLGGAAAPDTDNPADSDYMWQHPTPFQPQQGQGVANQGELFTASKPKEGAHPNLFKLPPREKKLTLRALFFLLLSLPPPQLNPALCSSPPSTFSGAQSAPPPSPIPTPSVPS